MIRTLPWINHVNLSLNKGHAVAIRNQNQHQNHHHLLARRGKASFAKMSLADFVEKRVYVNGYMLLLVLRKAGHGIYNVPVKFSVDSEYLLTREYLFFDPF